jgi:hypothetical protein
MTTQPHTTPQDGGTPADTTSTPTPESVSPGTNNVPDIIAPSISSAAMLVELTISQWMGRKKDRKASEEVTAANHAATGVANVNKNLLGNCADLTNVHKLTAAIRHKHVAMTMPWSNTGLMLLPTKQYFNYHAAITEQQNEWQGLVNTFLSTYNWEISQAEVKLGDLFHRDEYPTSDMLLTKFAFNLNYIPLSDAGDFRLDIEKEAHAQIKDNYESYYSKQLTTAMNNVWTRLHTALTNMSERLDYNDDSKNIFRDSLVNNVHSMVDLLDVCNVTGDSQMAALRVKLSDTLYGVTPDGLREDSYLRSETKRGVDDIIKSLPSIGM